MCDEVKGRSFSRVAVRADSYCERSWVREELEFCTEDNCDSRVEMRLWRAPMVGWVAGS